MKSTIKTLSNSNLCPDTVYRLAGCIRDAGGSLSYRKHGTSSMDGPLHLVSLAGGVIKISIPLSAAFVEVRVRDLRVEQRISARQFDDLLLRQGGYQKEGDTAIVTCLNSMLIDLIHVMAKVLRGDS
ncbi:MAG: hypothetical protein ACRDDI_13510 [Aeromonas veronii]